MSFALPASVLAIASLPTPSTDEGNTETILSVPFVLIKNGNSQPWWIDFVGIEVRPSALLTEKDEWPVAASSSRACRRPTLAAY